MPRCRTHLLVHLALPVSDAPQSYACEEVDAEAHVLHGILREDACEVLLQAGLSKTLIQLHEAKVLTQLLRRCTPGGGGVHQTQVFVGGCGVTT
jgi:hypothetical protein